MDWFAEDDTGLRAAEQLVAAERNDLGAGLHALLHGRLEGEAIGRRIKQRAAAQVVDQQRAPLTCQLRPGRRAPAS